MSAVRLHGMRVFQQLFHQGHIWSASDGGVPWGVSTFPSVYGLTAEPMRSEQIEELVAAFAAAARRCQEGGLDGAELHAGHGYLAHQFLSPLYNDRTDEYGGSLEDRMRFTREVLGAMRAAVGDEFVIGIRMSASEMPGSIREDELRLVIDALQREGLIDYLTTSMGDHYRCLSIVGAMESPPGYEIPSAGQLTSAASVPSIVAPEKPLRYRPGIAQDISKDRRRVSRLLLKAIRSLPDREQDAVLAYLLERALVDPPSAEAPPREGWTRATPQAWFRTTWMEPSQASPWVARDATLILQRLARGETVEQIAPVIGLDARVLRAVLQDLARRSYSSDRLPRVFDQLAHTGTTIAQLARELDASEEEIAAELEPSDELINAVSAALLARTAVAAPPAGYLGTSAQGPLRTIPVRFPEQQYRRLKDWCERNNFPMAVVVRGVVERFLDEQQRRAA